MEQNHIFFFLKQIYMNLLIYNIVYARKKTNSKGKYARPKPIINYIIKINKKESQNNNFLRRKESNTHKTLRQVG